jgi:hypothetical protein
MRPQPRNCRLTPRGAGGLRFAAVTAAAGRQLLDVLEQRRGTQIEGSCELRDRPQPRFAARAFQQRHLSAMQVASVAERFLRQAGGESSGAKVRCELRYRIHTADAQRLRTEPLQTTHCTRLTPRVIVCALQRPQTDRKEPRMPHDHALHRTTQRPNTSVGGPITAAEGVRS